MTSTFAPELHPRDMTRGTIAAGRFVTAAHDEAQVELATATDDVFSDECTMATGPLLDALHRAGRQLMDEHGLEDWTLAYSDSRGRALGKTQHHIKTITLDAAHMAAVDGAERRDTILHEIAHAMLPSHEAHGWRWQATARKIGARPDARTDLGAGHESAAAVVGTCPEGHTVGRSRMPTNAARLCCGRPEHPKDQPLGERRLTWTRNAVDPDVKAAAAKYRAPVLTAPAGEGEAVRFTMPGHHLHGRAGYVVSVNRTRIVVRLDGYVKSVRAPFNLFERA